jgi:hypothetical protein
MFHRAWRGALSNLSTTLQGSPMSLLATLESVHATDGWHKGAILASLIESNGEVEIARRKMRVRAYLDEMAFIADVTGLHRSTSLTGASISMGSTAQRREAAEWRCYCGLDVPLHQKEVHTKYCEHFEQASISLGDAGATFNALVKGNTERVDEMWR